MRGVRRAVAGLAAIGLAAGTGCVLPGGASVPWKTKGSDAPAAKAAGPGDDLSGPDAGALALTMAESLEKQGKEVEAVAYYREARDKAPAAADRATRRLAVLYDRLDQQALAMGEFQALLKAHPKDAALLTDVGYSYYNRGQWVEAESHLRRALMVEKADKRAWNLMGLTLAQQGKPAEAIDAFERAVTRAEAHANLGFVYASQGKRAEAAAEYRQALTLEPTLQPARDALARLDGAVATTPAAGGS